MPSPFEWSGGVADIFWHQVDKRILDDPRTDWGDNRSLGYPFEVIRQEVLTAGLADFSQGHVDPRYGTLTPEDKVLLYCFSNMKQHFLACCATYEVHCAILDPLFSTPETPLILDVGCGPATACLALADRFPGRKFAYLGIDLALQMQLKGRILLEEMQNSGLINEQSNFSFANTWDEINPSALLKTTSVIALSSYFFASHSLTLGAIRSLAGWIKAFIEQPTTRSFVLVYMNSTNPLANRNYEVFKQLLGVSLEGSIPVPLKIEYRTKRGGAPRSTEFVHEVLRLKG